MTGPLEYGFLKKLLNYECTSCQLTISSHQNMVGYLLHPPNFDDWKWSPDKRCICNTVTSEQIHTFVEQPTIDCVPTAYSKFMIEFSRKKNVIFFNFIQCNFLVRTVQNFLKKVLFLSIKT